MTDNLDTDNLGHRFLGHLPFPARASGRGAGGSGTEEDLDEYTQERCGTACWIAGP
jgi:hypothetical protein